MGTARAHGPARIHGAIVATGLHPVNRAGGRYPQTMHPADLEVTSLTALARILTDARGHVE